MAEPGEQDRRESGSTLLKLREVVRAAAERAKVAKEERVPHLNPYEKLLLGEAEKEQRKCEGCKGLEECRRVGEKGLEVVIEGEWIGVRECRYQVAVREGERIARWQERGGIPLEHRSKRRERLSEEEVALLERVLSGEEREVRVPGEGKEELLSIMGNEAIKEGLGVRYEEWVGLESELRVTNPYYHEEVRGLKEVEVLIIEGKRRGSRYIEEQVGMIKRYRRRMGLRTIENEE